MRTTWLPLLLTGLALADATMAAEWVAPTEVAAEWRPTTPGDFVPGEPAQHTFREWPPPARVETPYWLPWSTASFNRAALFDRPVFFLLTVNWSRASHGLMEGALASPEVLRAVNAGYVMIRVNADLRPDIRERYQTGVWPTVAFLLPNGQPMLSQANNVGKAQPITVNAVDAEMMKFLVEEGTVYWNKWPSLLRDVAQTWVENDDVPFAPPGPVDAGASEPTARWMLGNADRTAGGFGAAPKFVVPGLEEYGALREARGSPAVRAHSRLTLERLTASPLYDRRDGGIHRMATAPGYEGLQYEKMLQGNAALVRELVFSLRGADSDALREALGGTVAFLLGTLARPDGGFHLAQVADPASADGGAYWRDGGTPPPVDPVVLSGPTATAGAALLRAGVLLDDPAAITAGRAAVDRVLVAALETGRGVRHALDPRGTETRFLVSQADAAWGFVDAYESTGDPRYLEAARQIVDFARLNLADPGEGALRDMIPVAQPVGLMVRIRRPLRPNALLARVLLRLAIHGAGDAYREQATGILAAFTQDLGPYRVHGTTAALAVEEAIADPLTVTLRGPRDDPRSVDLRRAALNASWPWLVVRTEGGDGGRVEAVVERGQERTKVRRPEELAGAIAEIAGIDRSGK